MPKIVRYIFKFICPVMKLSDHLIVLIIQEVHKAFGNLITWDAEPVTFQYYTASEVNARPVTELVIEYPISHNYIRDRDRPNYWAFFASLAPAYLIFKLRSDQDEVIGDRSSLFYRTGPNGQKAHLMLRYRRPWTHIARRQDGSMSFLPQTVDRLFGFVSRWYVWQC